ncbi:regulatory protein RecX [Coralloluteibacterium stylophorae]|uniref:Regulatory protein RecX n=1 Tax=Coralloluteibacterium stylophorae TaxID=1776034 RepID=A0AAP2G092_9GAMM|nr:regulatory protein RecX [Coralloluteibacterium stylophorae]MBS7458852.1 regulatory protein RecX [Coralloluteibacterium stylophorae]
MTRGTTDARSRAVALLARREHSRRELERKLRSKGFESGEVTAAIEDLADRGWQGDARFADTLVRTRVAGGYGPLRIRMELEQHGVEAAAGEAAMADVADWRGLACDVARRRWSAGLLRSDHAQRRKAVEFLVRRGFAPDDAHAAIADLSDPA